MCVCMLSFEFGLLQMQCAQGSALRGIGVEAGTPCDIAAGEYALVSGKRSLSNLGGCGKTTGRNRSEFRGRSWLLIGRRG